MTEKDRATRRSRTGDLLITNQLLQSKRKQAQAIVAQVPAKPSNRTAVTSQNGAKAKPSEKRQKLTPTPGQCSACGMRMGWEVIAGLCGFCPPEVLRAFVDRINGTRETRRSEAIQRSLDI